MAKQVINIGTVANDGTGDPLRTSFNKTNQNFTELYDNKVEGSGTATFIPKWSGTDTIANSLLRDNGSNVVSLNSVLAAQNAYYTSCFQVGNLFMNSAGSGIDNTLASNIIYTGTPTSWTRVVAAAGGLIGFNQGDMFFTTVPDGAAGSSSIVSEKFRIKNTGNVGIGTSTPSEKLHVVGDVNIDTGIIKGTAYSTSIGLSTNVDFRAAAVFTKTLTANTTLTFSNTEIGMVKDLVITGDFTLTLPTGSTVAGTYDGTVSNLIQIVVTGAAEYWYSISQPQV